MHYFLGLMIATWVFLAALPQAWATHPLRAFEYEFLRDAGEFRITGGFAGFDLSYQLKGGFHLMLDTHPHSSEGEQAKIFDVNAVLDGPAPFDGASLDDLVNLSGLTGKIDGPSLIRFAGHDNQLAPMRVDAMHLDIGLKLDGYNRPPCCDFFNYELKNLIAQQVFSPPHNADFDGDFDVDNDDLKIWIRVFSHPPNDVRSADADGDGDTDGNDYLVWQQQFGRGIDSVAGTAIPEPATWFTLILGVVGLAASRKYVPRHR